MAGWGYVYLDIRAPEEYKRGHPVGAFNVPFKFLTFSGHFRDNARFIEVVEKLFKKDQMILVIGKVGQRSLEAAEAMEAAGFENIAELRPGYLGLVNAEGTYDENGWSTLGLPSETVTEDASYKEILGRLGLE